MGRSFSTVKPLHFASVFVFVLFYAAQGKKKCVRKSELLFWNKVSFCRVFAVVIICLLGAMKIKDSVEQITLDLFQNCYVPEEVQV